jgi:hypothetical protein
MQSVPAPHLIGAPARLRRRGSRALLLAAVVAAAALAAAPSLTTRNAGGTRPFTPGVALVGGLPMQQARCEQWLSASSSEKSAALDTLHGVVGGPTSFGPATALTRAEATRLFDRTCARPYARSFLLYELYTRAAGFRSLVTR